jgi:hypothetical protein
MRRLDDSTILIDGLEDIERGENGRDGDPDGREGQVAPGALSIIMKINEGFAFRYG